ncbi:hypothetical protein ACVWZM_004546 [Bradyrhizobium sp. USDA 4501]
MSAEPPLAQAQMVLDDFLRHVLMLTKIQMRSDTSNGFGSLAA